jgi:tetratricopeptide (TPR) repeat protein/transglutaminase-like putative cysteine protease
LYFQSNHDKQVQRMSFRYLYSLLFLTYLFCCSAVWGQQTQAEPAPDTSREALIFEQQDTHIIFENDGTGTREQSARIHILSDTGVQQFGIVTLQYQSSVESLDLDYVRVHKSDGTVVSTPLDDVQDMPSAITQQAPFYSDFREKHIAVKGLSAGDTLEFKAHWHVTKPLAPDQFWYSYNFDDENIEMNEQLRISVPAGRAVKWQSPSVKPTIEEKDGRQIFTWKSTHLERKSAAAEDVEQEKQAYQAARGQLAPPDVEFSSFQSWEEVGRWYGSLQADRVQPGPEIKAKAAELTKGLTTDDEKIRAIYRFVSEQFRYIGIAFGIGRYQPHTASEVLSNQYGDCKDKHTLLASLLQAVGITAYPTLINSAHATNLDVPTPLQFDHVIGAVPEGNGYLWLDTTAEIAPPGVLVPVLRDKLALVIPPDKAPHFVRTPQESPIPDSLIFKVDGKLSDAGVLDAQFQETAKGDRELILRSVFRKVSEAQWNQLMQNISYQMGFAGTVSDVSATQPDAIDKPFNVKYQYHRTDYSDWEHHQITLPFGPIQMPRPRVNQTELSAPVWLGSITEDKFTASVSVPDGYVLRLPDNVQLKTDFAEYSSSYSFKDHVITGERHLVIKEHEVPITEFQQYKSFLKSIDDDWNKYIVLTPSGSEETNLANPMVSIAQQIQALPNTDNAEALAAEQRAGSAMFTHDMRGFEAALKDAVNADPKFVRAWITLSQIYLSTGRQDEGLDALRKAVDASPESSIANKMLAFGLMQTKKYDEALKIWQRLQKLTPDDQDVTDNMVLIYMQQKHYDEAIQLLEASLKGHPDNVRDLYQLGFAYVKVGNTEKGLASYQSALKLKPNSIVENDVAYELAEANVAIPQALEYSQKSVNEEESASQKVQLDHLQPEDPSHTQKLGSFWDTLGWIYFRMGNLEKAESYTRAAFELSQSPVVADHLGQIYEQEHKTAPAIRMYRIASLTGKSDADVQKRLDHLTHTHDEPYASTGPYHVKVDKYGLRNALNDLWTVRLPKISSDEVTAEFFVLLGPGGKAEGVHFISGSEKLNSAGKTLSAANFKAFFPTGSNARILRRGILACYKETGCSFTELAPSLVHSVN